MTISEIKKLRKGNRVVYYQSLAGQLSGKVIARTDKFLIVKWDGEAASRMIPFAECTNLTRVIK